MPWFSPTSLCRLATCDTALQFLFKFVIKHVDCTIIEGQRGRDRQNKLKADGLSTLEFPGSKHNKTPSQAVDAGPYPLRWPPKISAEERKIVKEYARWYRFVGFVEGVAAVLGIPIRVGADWDGDQELTDQNFDDLPHFEIRLPDKG